MVASATTAADADPTETQEWLDALEAVVRRHGKARGVFLLSLFLRARAPNPTEETIPGTRNPRADALRLHHDNRKSAANHRTCAIDPLR